MEEIMNGGTYTIHSKIWIEDEDGHVVFGEGRYRILEAVDRLQSLQAAAGELKMSYRALWGRIKASEERLAFQARVLSQVTDAVVAPRIARSIEVPSQC